MVGWVAVGGNLLYLQLAYGLLLALNSILHTIHTIVIHPSSSSIVSRARVFSILNRQAPVCRQQQQQTIFFCYSIYACRFRYRALMQATILAFSIFSLALDLPRLLILLFEIRDSLPHAVALHFGRAVFTQFFHSSLFIYMQYGTALGTALSRSIYENLESVAHAHGY